MEEEGITVVMTRRDDRGLYEMKAQKASRCRICRDAVN